MKDRVLITGASGFIGRHLYTRLTEQGLDCVGISRTGMPSLGIIAADLRDAEVIHRIINDVQPNVIFHLAAVVNSTRDYGTAVQCLQSNTTGTLNLLRASEHLRGVRLVLASTEEVYGKNRSPFRERQLPRPPSSYAISKLAAEHLCTYHATQHNATTVVLRIGTTYGPGQSKTRYIPRLVLSALSGNELELNSGRKRRDYVFIDDVVRALVLASQVALRHRSTTINIGGGRAITLTEFAKLIIKSANSTSEIRYGVVAERHDEAHEWLMDLQKARRMLGWQPETEVEAGIETLVSYTRASLAQATIENICEVLTDVGGGGT